MIGTDEVAAFVDSWVAAFNSRDLDRHMALYAEDAVLFGAVDELQVGRDGVRRYFAARGPGVRVHQYPVPHIVHVAPDVVATAAHVDFADGDAPMPYRVTWVLARRGNALQILQHHGSPRRGP